MKVLVCIDLSPLSVPIADQACKIATMTGASLLLVHAVRAARAVADLPQLVAPDDMEQRVTELESIATRLRAKGVSVEAEVKLTESPIPHFLVDESVRTRADLILVGSHGRSKAFELFVGSSTQGVIREAMIPVVVVNGTRSVGGPG